MRFIRMALQLVLFFLLLSVVIGIGSVDTGPVEKVALVPIGLGLVWLAVRVRDLGRTSSA